MSRSYEGAIDKLTSLQTITSVVAQAEKESRVGLFALRNRNLELTRAYLHRLGISDEAMKTLRAVHVAGTKGKGSTCAITESILRNSGYKTGFLSSPHLMEVRERIRLNGMVMSRDQFAKYFHQIWDMFERYELTGEDSDNPRFPSYHKYLVVMGYFVFVQERVDVAVIEVGLGGRFDCTNVLRYPAVSGITHLGYDHCSILGYKIEDIAWEKAGIMKEGVPVYTISQHYKDSLPVLETEAKKSNAPIYKVPCLSAYPNPPSLPIDSDTWSDNISLALQLSRAWIRSTQDKPAVSDTVDQNGVRQNGHVCPRIPESDIFTIPKSFTRGIEQCRWPGRYHEISRDSTAYYLDGAHTPVSITKCAEWFKRSTANDRRKKILIANTTRDRLISDFLETICKEVELDQVIFCPNISSSNYVVKDCEWPVDVQIGMIKKADANKEAWDALNSDTPAFSYSSVEEAVWHVDALEGEVAVLLTGSLHLVGAALQVLDPSFIDKENERLQNVSSNKENKENITDATSNTEKSGREKRPRAVPAEELIKFTSHENGHSRLKLST